MEGCLLNPLYRVDIDASFNTMVDRLKKPIPNYRFGPSLAIPRLAPPQMLIEIEAEAFFKEGAEHAT